jgi:hypothetical protein
MFQLPQISHQQAAYKKYKEELFMYNLETVINSFRGGNLNLTALQAR